MGQLDEVSHKIGGIEARLDAHMKSSGDFHDEMRDMFDRLEQGICKRVTVLEADENKRKGALVVIGAGVSLCVSLIVKFGEHVLK